MVEWKDLDLVIIFIINRDYGAIVFVVLENNKYIIVEYFFFLDLIEVELLIILVKKKNKLLYVEYIEFFGGFYNIIKEFLFKIGKIFYVCYVIINFK